MNEERVHWENIVSVGDIVKPLLADFEKKAAEIEEFAARLRQKVSAIAPDACPIHSIPLPLHWERTLHESYTSKKTVVIYDACPECVGQRMTILVNERLKAMGIPDKVRHATFENFEQDTEEKKKALRLVKRQMEKKSGFLVLRGKFGTGKTHLAAAILKKSMKGLLITEADLLGELRQTYADNSGSDRMVDRYRTIHNFVLDELSLEVHGKDVPSLLYRILGYRFDKGLLTIITSNETLATILEIFGGALKSRIKDNYTVVTCDWEDHRGQAAQESHRGK